MRTIYKCFPGGKFKAVTMSYDDGREADRRLIKILNKNGIKGTFHLNSGIIEKDESLINDEFGKRIQVKDIKKLYEGHEVSAHTSTHPTIERCPITQVVTQVVEDRKALEDIVKYPVRGLSYPNGSYSEEIKKMLSHVGIEYSRVVGNSHNFELPKNLYEWKATCHHNQNLDENAEKFLSLNKKQYLYLFYVWGHSYEFDRDNNWNLIENFCKKVGKKHDVWYATNIEIVDYLKAFDNLQFSMDGSFVYNPSFKEVCISVDNIIYEIKGGETVVF